MKVACWSWGSQSTNSAINLEVTYVTPAHNSLIRTNYLAPCKHEGAGKCKHAVYLEGGRTEMFQEKHY